MEEPVSLKQKIMQSLKKYKEVNGMLQLRPIFVRNTLADKFMPDPNDAITYAKSVYNLLFQNNDPQKINQFEDQIPYCRNDLELLEKCVLFYQNNGRNSLFCTLIREIFNDINRGVVSLMDVNENAVKDQLSKVLGSGKLQILKTPAPATTQATSWKNDFDEARKNYAEGKAAFRAKKFQNAMTLFQLAKDGYKDALSDGAIDDRSKQEAKNRRSKMKDDPNGGSGKYAPSRCKPT